MSVIENATVVVQNSHIQIVAHINDQAGDIIKELGRGQCIGKGLVYESKNYTISLITEGYAYKKKNFISVVLDSKFGYSLGETIGKGIPEIIGILGKERVNELINKLL